jgi:hypothetical protein
MLTAKLQSAIAESYEVFATFSLPKEMRASPLRDANEIVATLSSAPLRQLTGEQVGPYAGWALTTVGDDRDYRHFLPRIFELSVADPVWLGGEPPVMANKLNRASWRSWSADQRDAVLRFFRAAFEAVLATHPDEGQAADLWFCGLVKLGESASLTFQLWRSSTSSNAALHLASFVIDEAKHLQRHQEVRGPFWDDVDPDIRRDVANRLTSADTKSFLETAADRVSADDRFQYIDSALANLERQF